MAIAAVVQLAEGSGRAIAINGVWGNMGFAGAALFTGMLTEAFGWRMAFIVPGVVALLLGVAAALLIGRSLDVVRAGMKQPAAASADRQRAAFRVFVFVAVSAIFGGLVFNGITVAMPKLFEEQLGSWSGDIARVGVLTALAFAVAAFAQLPVGALLDRHGAKPVVVTILALQVPLLALVGQAFGPAALPVAIGALLLVFGEIPVTDWLLGRYVAGAWQSRVYAVSDLGGLGVSVIAVPAIAFLHELSGGFALMFLLLAAAAAAAGAAALWLPGGRETTVAPPLESASHPPFDDAHRPPTVQSGQGQLIDSIGRFFNAWGCFAESRFCSRQPVLDAAARLALHPPLWMAVVAQLVRAPGCGPGGWGFESPRSPQLGGAARRARLGQRPWITKPSCSPTRPSIRPSRRATSWRWRRSGPATVPSPASIRAGRRCMGGRR